MRDMSYAVKDHDGKIVGTCLNAWEAADEVMRQGDRRAWEIRYTTSVTTGLIDACAWIQDWTTGTWRATVYTAGNCETEDEAKAEVVAKIIADEHQWGAIGSMADFAAEILVADAEAWADDAEATAERAMEDERQASAVTMPLSDLRVWILHRAKNNPAILPVNDIIAAATPREICQHNDGTVTVYGALSLQEITDRHWHRLRCDSEASRRAEIQEWVSLVHDINANRNAQDAA
jgi:hypothetical protein